MEEELEMQVTPVPKSKFLDITDIDTEKMKKVYPMVHFFWQQLGKSE